MNEPYSEAVSDNDKTILAIVFDVLAVVLLVVCVVSVWKNDR